MPFEHMESAQQFAPTAAAPLSVTLAASWGAGSYVEALASAAADAIVLGMAGPAQIFFSTFDYELVVGVGAAGAEVEKATWRGGHMWTSRGTAMQMIFMAGVDCITSGDRVAIRGRNSDGSTHLWNLSLCYAAKPVTGSITTTTNPLLSAPASATGVSVTPSGTGWANSAIVELVASTADAWLLQHLTLRSDSNGSMFSGSFEIDVMTGPGGSEVVVDTLRGGSVFTSTGDGCLWVVSCGLLFDGIPASTRVSVRFRKTGTSTTAVRISANYYNKTGF